MNYIIDFHDHEQVLDHRHCVRGYVGDCVRGYVRDYVHGYIHDFDRGYVHGCDCDCVRGSHFFHVRDDDDNSVRLFLFRGVS